MTDSTGIFQHASFTAPNLSEDYCTDDKARALILAVLLDQLEEAPKRVRAPAKTYTAFLDYAFDYLLQAKGDRMLNDVREDLTGRLMAIFDEVAKSGWARFKEGLIYDNAKLAHAMIVSGRATRQRDVCERGKQALRWLAGVQTSQHIHLRPIGSNGFHKRNGAHADFNHQPIEVPTSVSACVEAYRATTVRKYEQAQRVWFLGWNGLALELYGRQTDGCRDGLHTDRSNEDQGVESTLAYLQSLAEMRLMKNTATGVRRTALAAHLS